jgi:hypothetical protein
MLLSVPTEFERLISYRLVCRKQAIRMMEDDSIFYLLIYVMPLVLFFLAGCMGRGFAKEIPYRVLVFFSFVSSAAFATLYFYNFFKLGALQDEIFNLGLLFSAVALASAIGLWRPYSLLHAYVLFIMRMAAVGGYLMRRVGVFWQRCVSPNRGRLVLLGAFFLVSFFLWFVPFTGLNCGEAPVVKFRFEVWTYQGNDYGSTNPLQVFFEPDLSKFEKYGHIAFFRKIGGPAAYFGLEDAVCPVTGSAPTARR